jgi:hypothetical protein
MEDPSLELSLEDVYAVIASCGLEVIRREENISCAYTSNDRSVGQNLCDDRKPFASIITTAAVLGSNSGCS